MDKELKRKQTAGRGGLDEEGDDEENGDNKGESENLAEDPLLKVRS